jgi:hypothetical protein
MIVMGIIPSWAFFLLNVLNFKYHPLSFVWFGLVWTYHTLLVGGLEHFFFHILGIIIPTDFHIFQRGRSTTNQVIILGMMQVTSGQKSSKVIGPGSTKNSNHRELQDDHVDAVWRFCKISPDNLPDTVARCASVAELNVRFSWH